MKCSLCNINEKVIMPVIASDVGYKDVGICQPCLDEIMAAAQHQVRRTGYATRTELANAYADGLLAKRKAQNASR